MLVSNSEIQLFRRCKRQWALHYYLGYSNPDEPIYFTEGSIWHDALEAYYVDGYQAAFDSLTRAEMAADDELHTKIKWQKWRNLLVSYNEWVETEGIDQSLEVTRVEEVVQVPLGDHELRCKIDLNAYDSDLGHHVLLDHKTSGTGFKVVDTLPLNQQARTYALACLDSPDVPQVESAIYSITRKVDPTDSRSRPPYHLREKIYIPHDMIEQHRAELIYTVDEMQMFSDYLDNQGAAMPPTVEGSCGWCDFSAVCAQVGDSQSDWRWMLEANFVRTDPNARYQESGG